MFLKTLQLTDYRNYQKVSLEFKNIVTVLIGDNAQGKSNLLESIYYLATTKSLRASDDDQIIRSGEISAHLHGQAIEAFNSSDDPVELEINLTTQAGFLAKSTKINGLSRRIVDYIGNLLVVSFSPEDLNLVTDSPSLRRWHIDMTISQVDRDYKKCLTKYSAITTNKNKLLKAIREGQSNLDELTFWNDEQLKLGSQIQNIRRDFFDFVNTVSLPSISPGLTSEFRYMPNLLTAERLTDLVQKEIWNGQTLCGPGRDDFHFFAVNELSQHRDLAIYGSRGEQRSIVFNLKLAELLYYKQHTKTTPILLLDDIFSELDDHHRQTIIDMLPEQQTIIALIEPDKTLLQKISQATFFSVRNGVLEDISSQLV